jgi:DNA polymerase I-like protein with 3'-5' exonuclease and polymerase domains
MKLLLDIETTMDHKTIWCCVTKNIETNEVKVWKEASGLSEYLKAASTIIGHNLIGFDAPLLNKLWNTRIVRKQAYDTLVLSRLLNPNRENGHSLAELSKSAGSFKIDFTDYDLVESDIESLYEYCIQDIEALHKVYDMLMAEKATHGFSDESVQLEMDVAAIIKKQETNGFMLDVAYANTLCSMLNTEVDKISEHMQLRWPPVINKRYHKTSGKPLADEVIRFNVGSRQQVAEKLIEAGWKPTKLTPGGNPAVDEETLSDCDIPEAKLVLRYLMLTKRVSQVEQWLEAVEADGRIRGRVNTLGAVTGRMTHSKPNMAQIPNAGSEYGPECRQCFTVPEGKVLVGADASGLELRMLAHYMKDEGYVKTVISGSSKDGTDIHTVNQKAAGLPTRDAAKTFCYAFLYGAGDSKIGSIIGGGAREGKALKTKFLKQTPSLKRLLDQVTGIAASGKIPALDGRKLWVRSEHAALNTLLQGAGAIVMKRALVILDTTIRKNKWDALFVVNCHDEYQIECAEKDAEAVGKAAVDAIRLAGEYYDMRCPLSGEYKIGANWRQTH